MQRVFKNAVDNIFLLLLGFFAYIVEQVFH